MPCLSVWAREWKSIDGTKTFEGEMVLYKSPMVTIIHKDGRKITFNENILSEGDKRYCSLAKLSLDRAETGITYTVFQVLDDGMLCMTDYHYSTATRNKFFLCGSYKGIYAEGEKFKENLYWAGSYSYITVQSIDTSLPMYATRLDYAVAVLDKRLAPSSRTKNSGHTPSTTGESLTSSGTGFAISDTGHIVTNAHVIAGATRIEVQCGKLTFPANIVALDEQNDLAIIKVSSPTEALQLSTEMAPKLGDEITVGGFPNPDIQGMSLKLTKGIISGTKGIKDDIRHYQIDASVQPGNSGGPLLDKEGKVVGIVNARLNDAAVASATGSIPQNVNYAIKVDYLLPLLRSVDGLEAQVKAAAHKTDITVSEHLKNSTHFVKCKLKAK